jgi:hypothetical protein
MPYLITSRNKMPTLIAVVAADLWQLAWEFTFYQKSFAVINDH